MMGSRSFQIFASMMSGAFAGGMVDLILFPLDTIKTRLQSKEGFIETGGFKNIYKGLGASIIGSIPATAIFFLTLTSTKKLFESIYTNPETFKKYEFITEIISSFISESVACTIRVPAETMKQRIQVDKNEGIVSVFRKIKKNEGINGFYRAYIPMLSRELPYSCIEYPFYGLLCRKLMDYYDVKSTSEVPLYAMSFAGSLAGCLASGLTTPFDTFKTRVVLNKVHTDGTSTRIIMLNVIKGIYIESNRNIFRFVRILFSGIVPRVMWNSLGGFVYFGSYDMAVKGFNLIAPNLMNTSGEKEKKE